MSTSKLIAGILGAAAAGVVIGMLIAPEKGEHLRKSVRRTADDWVEEISDWIGKGKKFVEDMKNVSEKEADAAVRNGIH